MKKIIVAAFFMVSGAFYGQGKTDAKSNAFFGLKTGVNVHPTKDNDGDTHFSFGYQVGSTLNVPISSKFSFQPELLLQFIGSKYDYVNVYSNGTETGESKIKSFYLNVPLNFKYTVTKKVAIELGPNVSYLLSGKQKVTRTTNMDGVVYETNYESNSDSNKLSFGINLGTEYNITKQIYTGLRYTLFITKYQTADDTLSNSVFALSLGYNFK